MNTSQTTSRNLTIAAGALAATALMIAGFAAVIDSQANRAEARVTAHAVATAPADQMVHVERVTISAKRAV